MGSKLDLLLKSEEGRFKETLEASKAKEVCMNCSYFNPKATTSYRCACIPWCIGVTLSDGVKDYLLKKIQ